MKAVFEPPRLIPPESSLTMYRRDDPEFEFNWHYHPEYELTYIVASQGQRTVGNHLERYRAGDLVLIGPNLPHVWSSDAADYGRRHRALVIQFSHALLAPQLELPEYRAVAHLLARAGRGLSYSHVAPKSLIQRLQRLDAQPPLHRLLEFTRLLDSLAALDGTVLASDTYVAPTDALQEGRMQRILAYLHAHGREPITVADVAREAHLSPHSFSRYFQQHASKRFSDYLTELRLGWACTALLETDGSIAEIAFASGFRNLSNFNRLFAREKSLSPRAYRSRFRQHAITTPISTARATRSF